MMTKIIDRCLALDARATDVYNLLAEKGGDRNIRNFWLQIAKNNELHLVYWNQLRTWAETGYLDNIFEDSGKVLEDLDTLETRIDSLTSQAKQVVDLEKAFALAFKLEFYLLHPIFEQLLQYQQSLAEKSPETVGYDRHVNLLFEGLYEHDLVTMELELLGETLHRLWQENRKMAILSNTDELTGVLNRRGLFNAMRHLAHLTQRNRNTAGVLMIDIDHFKQINDTCGHQYGDQVLQYVAATIRDNIRASDVIGRYGGEEFLVFLSTVDPDALKDVAEKIRLAVASGDGVDQPVTISIGGASGRIGKHVDQSLQLLIQVADKNLYQAKAEGRNRIKV